METIGSPSFRLQSVSHEKPTFNHILVIADLSRLIRAHKKPPGLIKSETCGSETIVVPYIVSYLPTFVDIDVAHDVDNCSLAVRRRYWPSVGKVKLGDFVTRRTLAIPTYESD